ncbi:SYT17 [Branchiostoma lanceolatum]|uniref:SYT17 protein n=1 Tax=Branchiostoma lanceolatum TaxID=7740 RepID=A0A8S4MMN3_BRALA|nr:SYT17 [Branchiostoma lanceolatum]
MGRTLSEYDGATLAPGSRVLPARGYGGPDRCMAVCGWILMLMGRRIPRPFVPLTTTPLTDLSISGTLEISLAYKLPQLLCVTVHRASGLVCWDGSKLPHPFVRVMVPGISMVEQTDVKRGTLDPEWEQTYEFPVPQEEFDYRYVVLNVCDKSSDGVSMGEAHIDLCNFDPEEGYTGSFPLADMRHGRSSFRQSGSPHAEVGMSDPVALRHGGIESSLASRDPRSRKQLKDLSSGGTDQNTRTHPVMPESFITPAHRLG